MNYILTISLLLISQLVQAVDESGSYAIWGAGQKSCFSYTKTRDSGDDSSYRYYLMGYLTAYNMQTAETYRISGSKDMTTVLAWFDEYCAGKPVHGFDQAVVEFIIEHYSTRLKRAKIGGRR